MTLTPTISSPSDLLCKLARERYRAFHASHPVHKADHLYNFCVTALAIKDFIFEHLGITERSQKAPYYDVWNKVPELVAATEKANFSKHLVLRDKNQNLKSPRTKSVINAQSTVVDVYIDKNNNLNTMKNEVEDYEIVLEGGKILQLWEFTNAILHYWQGYFKNNKIPYQKQTEDEYFGNVT